MFKPRSIPLTLARAVILILILILAPLAIRAATTRMVDPAFDATTEGWGTTAFAEIQAAIEVADAGDTIDVAPGTYGEQLLIEKAVTVRGAAAATTIIDGSGVVATHNSLVRIRNLDTGIVSLERFTLQQAPLAAGQRVVIGVNACQAGATIRILDNRIRGTGYSADVKDWGVYLSDNQANVLFRGNTIEAVGANAMLLERHTGPAEISQNTITLDPQGMSPAIFSMSYRTGPGQNNDVTGHQYIHRNVIDANGWGGIVMASAYGTAYNERTHGRYYNVTISENEIVNLGNSRRAIQLEVDGDEGGFDSPIIAGNTLAAAPGATAVGIWLVGPVANAAISDNHISGCTLGIYQSGTFREPLYAEATQVEGNQIIDGDRAILVDGGTMTVQHNQIAGNSSYGLNNLSDTPIDARNNWWGHSTGPHATANPTGSGDAVSDNVLFEPWWVDQAMSIAGTILLTTRGTPVAWFLACGIAPRDGHDWDDCDDYDSDGNGMPNWQEYIAGTDPNDPESLLKITRLTLIPGQPPEIEWIGGTLGPCSDYQIVATSCLLTEPFDLVAEVERCPTGYHYWTGDQPLSGFLFFRIIAKGNND